MNLPIISFRLLLAVATVGLLSSCANPAAGGGAPGSAAALAKAEKSFMIGADISDVQAAEDRGTTYWDGDVQKDILQVLKDHGFNYIRLRLFVNPSAPGGYNRQGYCDLPHTIAFAKRVKSAGMGFLLDFHYSDNWADPQKQTKPLAWRELPFDALVKTVHDYSRDAIAQLQAAGVAPDMVQIGNEITPGFLLNFTENTARRPAQQVSTRPEGSVNDWPRLGALLKAGIAGVREAAPGTLIMLHLAINVEPEGSTTVWVSNAATRAWVDRALAEGVRFDVLGLSCYPRYHGPPEGWAANFSQLVKQYPQLHFVAAEYSQVKRQTNDIIFNLPDRKGLGTFIWEPTSYGEAIFDRQGNALPGLGIYDQMAKDFAKR